MLSASFHGLARVQASIRAPAFRHLLDKMFATRWSRAEGTHLEDRVQGRLARAQRQL